MPKWLTATDERYSSHHRSHRRLAPADRCAFARLRLISCLSFAELNSGVGPVGKRGSTLVAGINLLRVNRPNDRPLAWICLAGCLLWIGIVCAFAATLPNPIDPRPVYHLIVSLVLVAFSLRTALGSATR